MDAYAYELRVQLMAETRQRSITLDDSRGESAHRVAADEMSTWPGVTYAEVVRHSDRSARLVARYVSGVPEYDMRDGAYAMPRLTRAECVLGRRVIVEGYEYAVAGVYFDAGLAIVQRAEDGVITVVCQIVD